jgi:hypothetical protein
MAKLPLDGRSRKPVVIVDENGKEVFVFAPDSDGVVRLAVDALISGGILPPIGTVVGASKQQNLALAGLSYATVIAAKWDPRFVSLAFSVPLVAKQTLTITRKSALGAAYNLPVEKLSLAPAATAEDQAYFYAFPPDLTFNVGDEISVTLTNTGGAETAVVSSEIRGEG